MALTEQELCKLQIEFDMRAEEAARQLDRLACRSSAPRGWTRGNAGNPATSLNTVPVG